MALSRPDWKNSTGDTIENTQIRPEEKKAKGKDVKVLLAYLAE